MIGEMLSKRNVTGEANLLGFKIALCLNWYVCKDCPADAKQRDSPKVLYIPAACSPVRSWGLMISFPSSLAATSSHYCTSDTLLIIERDNMKFKVI